MEKFFKKIEEYIEVYVDFFEDRPLACTIIIFVTGFALGTLAANSYV
jgi:hypothetical protein